MIKEFREFNESKFGDGFSIRDEFNKLKSMANEYISIKLRKLLEFISEIEDLMIIREDDYNIEYYFCNLRINNGVSSEYLNFDRCNMEKSDMGYSEWLEKIKLI